MLIFVKKSAATKTKIRILLKNIRIFCPPEKFYISLLLKISLFSFYTPFIFRKYFHFILAFHFLIVNILLYFFFIHQLYFCTFISPYITFQSQKQKRVSKHRCLNTLLLSRIQKYFLLSINHNLWKSYPNKGHILYKTNIPIVEIILQIRSKS